MTFIIHVSNIVDLFLLFEYCSAYSLIPAIISNGGAKPNIIPEETELKGQIRSLSEADLIMLRNKVQSCFEAAAKATECQVFLILSIMYKLING